MILAFDFRCELGHVHERFVQSGTETVMCDTCGKDAVRLMPAPRSALEGFSGAFPSASDRWARNRASKQAEEARHVERHGETRSGHRPGEYLGNTIGKK